MANVVHHFSKENLLYYTEVLGTAAPIFLEQVIYNSILHHFILEVKYIH